MTITEAIQTAYAQEPFGYVPSKLEALRKAYAHAILATWSAECSDVRRVDMAPYHEAERAARKALDVHMVDTDDLYL